MARKADPTPQYDAEAARRLREVPMLHRPTTYALRRPAAVTVAAVIGLLHGLLPLLGTALIVGAMALESQTLGWPEEAMGQVPWLSPMQGYLRIDLLFSVIGVAAAAAVLVDKRAERRALEATLILRSALLLMATVGQVRLALGEDVGLTGPAHVLLLLPALMPLAVWGLAAAAAVYLLESQAARRWAAGEPVDEPSPHGS